MTADSPGEESDLDDEIIALWRLHAHRMGRWLVTKQIPEDLAASMTNDAFLVLRRKWDRLRDGSPIAYAYTVARHSALEYWAKCNRDIALQHKLRLERPEAGADPFEAYGNRVVLRTALAELPPRQKEAVELRYLQELTVEETAIQMGTTSSTVKTNTRDGLRALRAALEKADAEEKE
jgi:RNA polymerase sigma factor (sigma-70 family)